MRTIVTAACAAWLVAGCGSGAGEAAGEAGEGAAAALVTAEAVADEADGAPRKSAARGLPANAIHVERAVIVDATGFEAPVAAATLFLPRGWQAEGGVLWNQQFMCTNGYNFDWSARSPDGAMSVHVLPQARWESNNYGAPPSTPGCQFAPYTDVRQYLLTLMQGWRPDAQPGGFRRRPDIERDFASVNRQMPGPMGEMRTWVEAGEFRFRFEERGAAREGSIAAAVIFSLTRTAAPGMPPMDALTGFALPAYAVTAPAGRFDAGFFEAIRRSIKQDPQWESRIAGHNAAIGRVALEESRKRSAAIAQSNAEIARIREEAWNAYQESSDRRAREFGEVLRGVETYDDPKAATGQVELSHYYDHAWRLDDGTYVLTNDPNFEPWRDLGIAGDALKPTR